MISPQKKYRVVIKDENRLDLDSSYSNKEIIEKIYYNNSKKKYRIEKKVPLNEQ